jgi:hypothetical protein
MPRAAKAYILAVVALLALAACSGGGIRRDDDNEGGVIVRGIDGQVSVIRPGHDPNAAYSQGLDLKTKGDCAGAIEKLRPVANIGPGYENAQTALGACLLQVGSKNPEPSADYFEGLTWLRRAGDAGWPEAQGTLAMAHAFGPSAIRNGEEAAYWMTLYETNPSKLRIGFAPLPTADIAAVEKSLSPAEKLAGVARARAWKRTIWLPPPSVPGAPESKPGPRRERRAPPLG